MSVTDTLRQDIQASLTGRYEIEREVGGGGMSRVFVAEETRFRRRVVIKVLAPELAAGLSVERFEREIALAATLQQANIVALVTAGDVNGLPWYSMPYVDGESLRARIERGAVPVAESVAILRDVARALAYAHARGIVHRDIKPENVLLSSGTAMVTDFGIAKAISRSRTEGAADRPATGTLTQVGTSLGTPAYMAPEQAAADPATDHRADLYAWGVLAYELLAGQHPFAGRTTPQQLLAAHMAEVPRALASTGPLGGAVPPTLGALVMRCLAKDPGARPASAAALLEVLDGSVWSGDHRSRAARRPWVGITAVIAIVAVAAGAYAWTTRRTALVAADATVPVMLAVLPFENAGPSEQAVFTDGLTDAVTAKLVALPGLAVIDRQSAAQYRQTTKSAKQIGTELGVLWLLEGVVRWAKDARGVWRAQVTPTLVDARAGTTRWTGTPVVITPDDPFTAQGDIAAKVADALAMELQPNDRAALARRMTNNPEAFAAWVRGVAAGDAAAFSASTEGLQRAATEFAKAVALDSTFAEAWGDLAAVHYSLVINTTADRAAEARLRATIDRALAHAPGQPRVLLTLANLRLNYDHDTTSTDTLVARALSAAPNDPVILHRASRFLFQRQRVDSGYALARRVAVLDPRSMPSLVRAAKQAIGLRRWDDARRYSDASVALDSTDSRGWSMLLELTFNLGDTIALRGYADRALAHVSRPDLTVLSWTAYTADGYGSRYVAMSARELGVTTLRDSVMLYYAIKADVFQLRREPAGARVYYDSIRTLLGSRPLNGPDAPTLLLQRAVAEAGLGDTVAARRTLATALATARRIALRADLTDVIIPYTAAAVYARLGEPETAVRWLAAGLANPSGGYTARGYAIEPSLFVLRGTPAFERFLREHPQ